MKLLTPGPVQLPRKVIEAIATQPMFHRSDEFKEVLRNVLEKLRKIYNATPIVAPGTGTFAVDMAVYNFIDPGDKVVALVHGEFGYRMALSAESRGAKVYKLETKILPPSLDAVEDLVKRIGDVKAIIAVHNETSLGVTNRYIDKLQRIAENVGAILIIDSVSALPAEPIKYKVDVIATATHKAFMAPPGGAIIYVNGVPRAKAPVPPSMDLEKFLEKLDKLDPPYTPPINVIYGLNVSLDIILNIGVEAYHELHRERAELLYTTIKLEPVPKDEYKSYTVTTFYTNKANMIIKTLRRQGYIVAGGMGEMKDKVIRIGVMGDVNLEDLKKVAEVVNSFVD
uniref:Alanine--glyoxylate aminotransferase family protein n=1 Tax=Ignisphaera aggregans TaxID=334771 RepID=A0A7C4JK61_9CREN